MRVTITVDTYPFRIDTTDPYTLGRWVTEIFTHVEPHISPSSYITVEIWPSYRPNADGTYVADFLPDLLPPLNIAQSAQEVINYIEQAVKDYYEQKGQWKLGPTH